MTGFGFENGVRVRCPLCGRDVGTWIRELVVLLRRHNRSQGERCAGSRIEVDPIAPSAWPPSTAQWPQRSGWPALLTDMKGWPWTDPFTAADVARALERAGPDGRPRSGHPERP